MMHVGGGDCQIKVCAFSRQLKAAERARNAELEQRRKPWTVDAEASPAQNAARSARLDWAERQGKLSQKHLSPAPCQGQTKPSKPGLPCALPAYTWRR